eukprot:TRINITY_DN8778_c0_g1_i1.p1 TRINITY_DN8778_c0_g1~~TRINITY_DN8778_c0_g1_i1.p1  ORF type:complete len:153 (+),score=29.22 TRINITY_DN8778_c0_g1_i1:43-501(+)
MTKTIKSEITARLKSGKLFSFPELKLLLKEFLRRITDDAHKDFDQLLFLTDFYRKVALVKSLPEPEICPRSTAASIMLPEQLLEPEIDDTGAEVEVAPRKKLEQLQIMLHYAIMHVATVTGVQRKERLTVMKDLLAQLEATGDVPPEGDDVQ